MTEMLDDVFTVSKEDDDAFKYNPSDFNVVNLINNSIDMTKVGDTKSHNFNFKYDIIKQCNKNR